MFLRFQILLRFTITHVAIASRVWIFAVEIFDEGSAKVFKSVHCFQLFSVHKDLALDVSCVTKIFFHFWII